VGKAQVAPPNARKNMELVSLVCGHCGAPLEVPEGTRYVTCGYCSSKLEVHRSGGAIYTEVLEALQRRTEEIADDVEILKLQNELERIDREWQIEREKRLVHGKHGTREPSVAGSVLLGIVCLGLGLVFLVAGTKTPPLILFGLGGIVAGLLNLIVGTGKAHDFAALKQQYEVRRAAAVRAIQGWEFAHRNGSRMG
jgi:LSD1 subclass zinc finger protein